MQQLRLQAAGPFDCLTPQPVQNVPRLTEAGRELERYSREITAKVDEIGQVMDISPGTARSHATTALRTLRTRLDIAGGDK